MRSSEDGSHIEDRQKETNRLWFKCGSLESLVRELAKPDYNPPTPEELQMIIEGVINGEREARDQIWQRSLRYVSGCAWDKATKRNPKIVPSLFSLGAWELFKASRKWNPRINPYFLGYASQAVEGVMDDWLEQYYKEKKRSFFEISIESHKTVYEDDEIEGFSLADLHSNPEREIIQALTTLEWKELEDQLLNRLQFHASEIENTRYRIVALKVFSDDCDVPGYILSDLLKIKIKRDDYLEAHLGWYSEHLKYIGWYNKQLKKEEKRVEQLPLSKIRLKLKNDLDYIWRRYIRGKVLEDKEAGFIISLMRELIETNRGWWIAE